MIVSNTEENREILARKIVDSWDLDTLMDYAEGCLNECYQNDNDQFEVDWDEEFGEESE